MLMQFDRPMPEELVESQWIVQVKTDTRKYFIGINDSCDYYDYTSYTVDGEEIDGGVVDADDDDMLFRVVQWTLLDSERLIEWMVVQDM